MARVERPDRAALCSTAALLMQGFRPQGGLLQFAHHHQTQLSHILNGIPHTLAAHTR